MRLNIASVLTLAASVSAIAIPLPGPPPVPGKFGVCLNIASTTVQWFLKEMQIKSIPKDTSLFYTRRTNGETTGLSKIATSFAEQHGLTSIWHVWPSKATNPNVPLDFYSMYDPTSPLRCIAEQKKDQEYFSNMSEAYAHSCKGTAYVMTDNPKSVPKEGIWWNAEFPTLTKKGSLCEKIIAIDINGKNGVLFWSKDGQGVGKDVKLDWKIVKKSLRMKAVILEKDGEDWFA